MWRFNKGQPKKKFTEFMSEEGMMSRWKVMRAALGGAFCGVLLATIYYMFLLV